MNVATLKKLLDKAKDDTAEVVVNVYENDAAIENDDALETLETVSAFIGDDGSLVFEAIELSEEEGEEDPEEEEQGE